MEDPAPTEEDAAIAGHALRFVTDGCTLQTGIGAVPNMVATALAEGSGGDYGVHSEMFTTGLMRLHQAGKVTNAAKGLFDGVSVTTFALGTADLYRWLDDNPEVAFLPVDVVNDPTVIGRNHKLVSINGAMCVDLYGQVVADNIDGKQISGVGGHEDFVAGADLHVDAHSLICLKSTVTVGGVVAFADPPPPTRRGRGLDAAPSHRGGRHGIRGSRAQRAHRPRTGPRPGRHRPPRFPCPAAHGGAEPGPPVIDRARPVA